MQETSSTFQAEAHQPVPIWRDIRVLQVFMQIVFAVLVVTIGAALLNNMFGALSDIDAVPDPEFFERPTRFEISEGPDFESTDPFARAFYVGVVNTLRVVGVGLFLSTVLGVIVGIARLSSNFLVRNIALVFVEVLRNTPLLVQLFFLYLGVFLALPLIENAVVIGGSEWAVSPSQLGIAIWLAAGTWLVSRRATLSERYFTSLPSWARTGFILIIFLLSLPALILMATLVLGVFRFFIPGAAHVKLPAFYLSRVGLWMPSLHLSPTFPIWLLFVVAGCVAAVVVWYIRTQVQQQTGKPSRRVAYATLVIVGLTLFGWAAVTTIGASSLTGAQETLQAAQAELEAGETAPLELRVNASNNPVYLDMPREQLRENVRGELVRRNVQGGEKISPEFLALVTGLVIYTAAFIAEVVRAGIQSVDYGQIEAARALGLSYTQILQLIVLPQALRVIIPPLGNQYLNLAKNSSLAVAIGYADVYQVSTTIAFQSGQSVIMIAMLMLTYLLISLTISFVMNWLNKRLSIKER